MFNIKGYLCKQYPGFWNEIYRLWRSSIIAVIWPLCFMPSLSLCRISHLVKICLIGIIIAIVFTIVVFIIIGNVIFLIIVITVITIVSSNKVKTGWGPQEAISLDRSQGRLIWSAIILKIVWTLDLAIGWIVTAEFPRVLMWPRLPAALVNLICRIVAYKVGREGSSLSTVYPAVKSRDFNLGLDCNVMAGCNRSDSWINCGISLHVNSIIVIIFHFVWNVVFNHINAGRGPQQAISLDRSQRRLIRSVVNFWVVGSLYLSICWIIAADFIRELVWPRLPASFVNLVSGIVADKVDWEISCLNAVHPTANTWILYSWGSLYFFFLGLFTRSNRALFSLPFVLNSFGNVHSMMQGVLLCIDFSRSSGALQRVLMLGLFLAEDDAQHQGWAKRKVFLHLQIIIII